MDRAAPRPELPGWAAALLLLFGVAALYARTWGHAFVEFDDPLYVSANGWVRAGLSWEGLRWAFHNDDAFLWHPLTWLSYLAESSWFGVERAGPRLAVNAALHALAALLLFLALARMTGRPLASLAVAAFFAFHPVQVESVAWVSARKEVLAGALCMATLLAYAGYARRESVIRYALVLVLFAACLMAKGTLLLLPLALLLLDAWPLRRARPPRRLLLEKLPLLAIAAADLAIQLQLVGRSEPLTGPDPALLERVPIALLALFGALARLLWPAHLSITYPTPEQMGLAPIHPLALAAVCVLLLALTAAALWAWRRAPWWGVGWLWFCLLIAPMTGLAPAGLRVMHDRYSYVPMLGIALALVFAAEHAASARRRGWRVAIVCALLSCAALSWRQVGVWRDSFTLFDHAIAVNERDATAWFGRGTAWAKAGDVQRALSDLERAVALRPDHADAVASIGYLRLRRGEVDAALPQLRRAVSLRPDWPLAHINLGHALEAKGESERALAQYERAAGLELAGADAHYWLGLALERRGRAAQARAQYERALLLDPSHHWSRDALARLR